MKTCVVIQPFNDKFNRRYADTFSIAIQKADLIPYRVDEDDSSKIPIIDIEKHIAEADIVFADITLDNPNVWYEIGFAYACYKDVVLICCSDERKGSFPFDIRHKNIITYASDSKRDFEELEAKITARLKAYLADKSGSVTQDTHIPKALQAYLSDFPAFGMPHNLQRGFVRTSRESFFKALECVLGEMDPGDLVTSTDSVNLSRHTNYVQYWAKEGMPYLKLNFEAHKRGVKFCRVFILDEEEHANNANYIDLLATLHMAAGVEPRYIRYQELLSNPTYLREFAVFGEKFVDETIYDVRSNRVIDNFIHWSRDVYSTFSEMSKMIVNLSDEFACLRGVAPAMDVRELGKIAKEINTEATNILRRNP